jgi:DNA repair exonuclease SbcCD ATPase subunit
LKNRVPAFALLVAVALPVAAQSRNRDPLSPAQAEEVRELADRPVERLKLYLKYVNERSDAIHELSTDSTANNRPAELRSRFEEFTRLVDELSDNMDSYDEAHADIRKALKAVIESSAKWPDVLHQSATDTQYEFTRKTALDAAQSVIEQAKQLLGEEEKYFAAHKDQAGKNGNAASPPPPPQ